MSGTTLSDEDLARGKGCQKGVPWCRCAVGWPTEDQCPDCAEATRRDSYCICPPPEEAPPERYSIVELPPDTGKHVMIPGLGPEKADGTREE